MRKLFAIIVITSLLALVACSRSTVPSAVLHDGQSQSATDDAAIRSYANVELTFIESEGIDVPRHTLAVVPALGDRGDTIVSDEPVRYAVVLFRYAYIDERQIRFTFAHEIFHVMANERGFTQGEAVADAFARCYGSDIARSYAETIERGNEISCEALPSVK